MSEKMMRSCIGCREKREKYELIRIVCNKSKDVTVDFKQKLSGRGAYICKNENCFEKAQKGNKLRNALKTNIDNEKYKELRGVIFD